jgi:flavin reductase (DIM6/NTAB) family NADH-FMN oxidoreductase RutF
MENNSKFKSIDPQILYFGTPVALITTVDENDNANIGPISSVWALGRTLLIGLETGSKTYQNLIKQKECVVNLPASGLFERIEKIATLTGANPIPDYKKDRYQYEADKFRAGGFTRLASDLVLPPRIEECSLQLEAVFKAQIVIEDDPVELGAVAAVEVRVVKIHADAQLIVKENHIDPAKWDPLIYNFRHYSGLGRELGKTFKAEI